MINFDEKNCSKEYVAELLDHEAINIQVLIAYQNSLKDQVLEYSKTFFDKSFFTSESKDFLSVSTFFSDLSEIFKNLDLNYKKCIEIENNFNNLKNEIDSSKGYKPDVLKNKFNNYNHRLTELNDYLLEHSTKIQTLLASCKQINIFNEIVAQKESQAQAQTLDDTTNPSNKFEENTLIISEKEKKVILPYTIDELNNLLQANQDKYSSLDDIVEKEFTKPLQYYKNSSLARFKEAFKLVKERDHGSLKHAIDLGLELLFNYSLHPAIITACKNVDELDVYLSCLEYDELEDFSAFKIIFDVAPRVMKGQRVN